MSYQQGYPQQPLGGFQDYPSGGRGNPALAIIAAVLALVVAAALVIVNVDLLKDMPGSISDLPGEMTTVIIVRFAAALILLIGLIMVFVRKLAGAFLIAAGALIGAAIVLLYPVLLKDFFQGVGFGEYLEALFKFKNAQATFPAIALIASPLALIASLLPPTLNYLRGSSASGYDYPQTPSGGYPQVGGGYPQQQGYPQQPQQPGW